MKKIKIFSAVFLCGQVFLAGTGDDRLYAASSQPKSSVFRPSPAVEREMMDLIQQIELQKMSLKKNEAMQPLLLERQFHLPEEIIKELEKPYQKKLSPTSYHIQNTAPGFSGFSLIQAVLPDLFFYFKTAADVFCHLDGCLCADAPTFCPGENRMTLHLRDNNRVLPPQQWPRDVSAVGGAQQWTRLARGMRYFGFDKSFRFPEPEEVLVTEGARTLELYESAKTIRLDQLVDTDLMDFWGDLPYRVKMELDGNRWLLYDLNLYVVLRIDPDQEIREGDSDERNTAGESGERNNRLLFRWIGMDRPDTEEEEIPPGFYFMGYWNGRFL